MARRWVIAGMAAMLAGCAREEKTAGQPIQPLAPVDARQDNRPVIVAFGDSLTAGHGVAPGLGFTDFLQRELDRKGRRYRVVNQGVSGDTSSGGAGRVDAALSLHPRIVILELGANDGLRGLPVETTRANLAEMIDAFQKSGAKVLLCGMTLPRNYGPQYIRSFEKVFQELSRREGVTLIPFFLEGVATSSDLMQGDGLHPTAEGNARVAAHVMKYLDPLL